MQFLKFPEFNDKSSCLSMFSEWRDFETTPTSPGRLFVWESYEEFLDIITTDVTANPHGVNSTLFFFMEDEEILGAIQVRHHIDHPRLSLEGEGHGHIGYGLRPSARGKWLANVMLSLGLEEARKLGIEKVVVSADETNPASWKTIEHCGGVLYDTKEENGKILKIYTIVLWK